MAELELKAVRKNYGKVEVIKGVDLSIARGEFVVFVGPSGCGKSTLLRMIAGLEEITSGELHIDNELVNDVEPQHRGVAMVFQSYALYPHMTVYDNVGFGLKLAKAPKPERDKAIRDAARKLQMEHLLDRRPAQLSGGQRQRVAIGRAIVRKPSVFLFDEPLSNLDAALRGEMRAELAQLHHDLGATMIYVTHDQTEAMTLADKIVVLESGVVQQIGTPLELYSHPANLFVARFIGSPRMNLFEVEVDAVDGSGFSVSGSDLRKAALPMPAAGVAKSQKLTLGVRPHALEVSKDGGISGQIDLVERLGHETVVGVRLASGARALAALEGNAACSVGDQMSLGFDHSDLHFFDSAGQSLAKNAAA